MFARVVDQVLDRDRMADAIVELVVDLVDVDYCDLQPVAAMEIRQRSNRVDQARMTDHQVVVTAAAFWV